MKETMALDADLPVILITAYGDIEMAVQAIRDGAYDFIEKPIDIEKLGAAAKRAMDKRSLVLENRRLQTQVRKASGMDARILGNSPPIIELREMIANLADTDASVLICGETGSGKELVARCLHDFSPRRNGRFVPVNCGAIPENLFESELFGHEAGAFTGAAKRHIGKLEYARGGTVFLDEIESMPLDLQVKLLRALDDGEVVRLGFNEPIQVNFRLVSATKKDLKETAKQGEFREDLYYRLNVAEVFNPPLRDRREDILLLFEFFADQLSARYERESPRLSRDDRNGLMTHSWPGNVRELKNVAGQYVLGLTKKPKSPIKNLLHPSTQPLLILPEQVKTFERYLIEEALRENNGDIQETMTIPSDTLRKCMA
jgi:DNA-binding NtrC family response regulator